MSQDQSSRRVIAVAPMPPDKSAYALARYSRSPDSIESSIKWVHGHSSEKFWDQFYFDYGHASIADLGHVIICFENISEHAAIRLEDEPLWDGQAKSSRYQNFAPGSWYIPDSLRGSETEGTYEGILRSLSEVYRVVPGMPAMDVRLAAAPMAALVLATFVAALVPAWRATRAAPMEHLGHAGP